MQPGPRRCGHFTGAAKPGYNSKVYSAQSQPLSPMEAIKPFIFYVWASWPSYCWRRRDTGPTSKEPRWNYSIWIIHCTWGRYLLKGQTCLRCPLPAVKLKAAHGNKGQTQVSSVGCGKHDLIWHTQTKNLYNWSGVSQSPGSRWIVRVYCRGSISGIEAKRWSCIVEFWPQTVVISPSLTTWWGGVLNSCWICFILKLIWMWSAQWYARIDTRWC